MLDTGSVDPTAAPPVLQQPADSILPVAAPAPSAPAAGAASSGNPLDAIYEAAGQEWNVDPNLLRAVAGQESGGTRSPDTALSPKGAQGRMQLMPDTAAAMGVTNTADPVQNIFGGAKYLSQQLDRYGSPELALAAYNAGPARLDGYTNKTTGQHVPGWLETVGDPRSGNITPQQFAARIPIAETAAYVPGIAQKYAVLAAGGAPGASRAAAGIPPGSGAASPPNGSALPAVPAGSPPAIPSAQPGNNMPLVSTGYGQGGFGSAPRVVIGDSLGVGMMQSGYLPGIAQGSVPPSVVLARINALPDGALSGKQVIISTGLSNSGTPQQRQADLAYVQQQVDGAKAKGAGSVVLAGVGDARFPGTNAGIQDIAQRSGALFTGPAPTADAAGVHPGTAGYRAMLAAAPLTPPVPQDGGATQRLTATLAALRQPSSAPQAPAASPAPGATASTPSATDPFSQALAAAQAASAPSPSAAAPATPADPFNVALQAAQAATGNPAASPAPRAPASPATPVSTAPAATSGGSAPSGAPVASDPFSQALAAAQQAAPATTPSPPPPTPPADPSQLHARTGFVGNVLNSVPALGNVFDEASRKLYDAIDYGNRVGPSWLAPDGSMLDRAINPAAAAANLDPRIAAYDRSGIANTPGGIAGSLVGQTALTAPLLSVGGGAAGVLGGRLAAAADAVAPEVGAALRYGGRLVSGTASSDNKLLNMAVRPASLAANGAVQGAAANVLTGNADPTTNLLTGAAAGGVLGPVATAAIKGVGAGYNALTGLARPFTTAGQGAIADAALARIAADGPLTPDVATYVPGSTPTLAQATNNAGLAGAERAVASVRPQPFATQGAINNEAREAQLGTLTGTPTDIDAAKAARNTNAVPAITSPIASATGPASAQPVVDTIDSILASPAGQRDAVQSALGNIRAKLVSPAAPFASRASDALDPITAAIGNGGNGDAGLWAARDALMAAQKGGAQQASTLARLQGTTSPDPAYQALIDQATARVGATNTVESDAGQLYGIRSAIGDALSPLAARTGSDAQLASSELQQVKAALDNSIEGVAPGFKAGLAEYSDASSPISAMRYLQGRNFTSADGTITLAKVKGALDDIAKQQALPGPRDAKNITPDTMTSLQGLYSDLLRQNNSRTGLSVGSNTFQNLATAATLGNFGAPLAGLGHLVNKAPVVGNLLTGAVARAYRGQNDAVMDAVVNRLINPTAGASVLDAATKLQASRAAGPSGVNPTVTSLSVALRNRLIGSQQP